MTYPLVGNYGINLEDLESDFPKVKGFIVRERCVSPSNFRCEMELEDYLRQNKITGLEGIDTRALTKILRNYGTMKGIITTRELSESEIKYRLGEFNNYDAVMKVTTKETYYIDGPGKRVAVLDFGIKRNILCSLKSRGCSLSVFPASSTRDEILGANPDLIFLSNGPGDPADLEGPIENIKSLIGKRPIAGICLGHQLLALAMGGKTSKLRFGHRGCNHPVKDLENSRVYITSQNHGYYVSRIPDMMKVTHISLNDSTIEGMRHESLPIYSVQFHPEASPGPGDASGLFDRFLDLAEF
jgi:carbamoyl-phosphate synthase small subunit